MTNQNNVFREGTERSQGRSAQIANIQAARVIADSVKASLGPRGMDKMLVDALGGVIITNDGATILKEVDVAHPAAKMVIEVAKTQDAECGDGTTTSVVLTGELLRMAQGLLEQGIHPTSITAGFAESARVATEKLQSIATPIGLGDEDVLRSIARTSLASKNLHAESAIMEGLVVKAVQAVADHDGASTTVDPSNIVVRKAVGGSIKDAVYVDGVVLGKGRASDRMPDRIEDAKVLLLDVAVENKQASVEARLDINTPEQLNAFIAGDELYLREQAQKLIDTGANVIFCGKTIDELVLHHLTKAGVYVVRRVQSGDLKRVSRATGATIVQDTGDLGDASFGNVGCVREVKYGEDRFTHVEGCNTNASVASIILRGGTEHVVDEAGRALHDALRVVGVALEDGFVTPGGGAAAVELALALRAHAPSVGGRKQMAVEAYANALETIPRVIAANAGHDEIDTIIALRNKHAKGHTTYGVDVETGGATCMVEANVIEPLRVGEQEVAAATEAAIMILRIDDVLAARGINAGGDDLE